MRLAACALLLAGCSAPSAAPRAADDAAIGIESGSWDDDVSLPETSDELVVRVPIAEIAPGAEDQRTIDARLPSDAPLLIERIDWSAPKGLHHSRLDAPPDASFHTYPVLALPVGVSDASESFPAGTALPLAAQQLLRVSYHYVNAGSSPITGEITLRLFPQRTAGARAPLSMLWLMNEAIDLPPKSRVDVETTCTLPRDVTLFDLVPHTHALGRGVEAFTVRDGKRIYASAAWSEGPRATFDPPLVVRAGESLRFVCHFENTTDARVTFGDNAADEMCVIAGHVTGLDEPLALVIETPDGPCLTRAGR